jgi:hypothetical protein
MDDVLRYGVPAMVKCDDGIWVTYGDYKKVCGQLDETQRELAVLRVELQALKREMGVSLLSLGCCPECGRKVYNYTPPTNADHEWIRQHGINPVNNHKLNCSLGSM